MSKRLLAKAGLINLPPAPGAALGANFRSGAGAGPAAGGSAGAGDGAGADFVAEPDGSRAKTAPGSMLQFMTAQSAAVKEAESLRERLAGFDGALPVRRLDARTVRVSSWANRHADSYQDAGFLALKADISAAGGNVQPIKVRPLVLAGAAPGQGVGRSNPLSASVSSSASGATDADVERFEIVFGHRRHRACLELGIPVLALVEDLAEQQLFVEMERENRARQDLSAWEQGMMYARALDQGLYPSNRQLANAIGRDLGDVGKALSLARLSAAVVEAFRSPLDLQYRWAKPLADAQQADPDGLVMRARALKAQVDRLTPKQIFEALIHAGQGRAAGAALSDISIRIGGKPGAVVTFDAAGQTLVRFAKPLSEERRRELAAVVELFLTAQGRAA